MTDLQRCPACGAAVTAEAEWCSLCYADLRAPTPPPESPPPESPPSETPAPPGTAPPTPDATAPTVDAMLAELAAAESAGTPGVLDRFSSRSTRVVVMIGGTLALALALVLLAWVLGALL